MGRPLGCKPLAPNAIYSEAFPASLFVSGEITASKGFTPIFSPTFDGRISDVYLSVVGCGRDDSNTLTLEADVLIGATSSLTTKPKIAGNNGSAAAAKSTIATGTGITQAAVNGSANSFSAGQVIGVSLALVRTASPTTEIKNAVVVVEMIKD